MRNQTIPLVLFVAAIGVGCSGVGVQTEATLGTQVLQEPDLASLWGAEDVLTTKEMSPSDEISKQRFSDAWMGPDTVRTWNGHGAPDADRSGADNFLERTMYFEEVTLRSGSQRAMRTGLTNGF